MGVYDEVGDRGIQIKCIDGPMLNQYGIGDDIPLPDGLFIGFEGWFVVKDGKVLCEGSDIYNKWGGELSPDKIISGDNPIAKLLADLRVEE